jgi:hypothetical protein
MSRLRVFRPRETDFVHRIYTESDEPVILSFKPRSRAFSSRRGGDLLTRARALHENARCPNCGRVDVEPLDLGDARLDRARRPIPCTSTLVGFHCHGCAAEWSA